MRLHTSTAEVSSAWLPPALAQLMAFESTDDDVIAATATIGGLFGDISVNDVNACLAKRRARPHPPRPSNDEPSKRPPSFPLPQFVAGLSLEAGQLVVADKQSKAVIALRLPAIEAKVEGKTMELSMPLPKRQKKQEDAQDREQKKLDPLARPQVSYDPQLPHTLLYRLSLSVLATAMAVEAGKRPVFELESFAVEANSKIFGRREGAEKATFDPSTSDTHASVAIETVDLALWRPEALSSIRSIAQQLDRQPSPSTSPPSKRPLVDRLPVDFRFFLSITNIRARLAGPDVQRPVEKQLHGIDLRLKRIQLEFIHRSPGKRGHIDWSSRKTLGLAEDEIADQANALATHSPNEQVALFSLDLTNIELAPVTDALAAADISTQETKKARRKSVLEPAYAKDAHRLDWELRSREHEEKRDRHREDDRHEQGLTCDILDCPSLSINVELRGPKEGAIAENRVGVKVEAQSILSKISLLHIYCALAAVGACRSLTPSSPSAPKKEKRPPRYAISFGLSVTKLEAFVTLPHNVRLLLSVRRFDVSHTPLKGGGLKIDVLLLSGVSVTTPGWWEDIIRIYGPAARWKGSRVESDQPIDIEAKTARVRIPYKCVRILDDIG